jgi:O-antigen ligase
MAKSKVSKKTRDTNPVGWLVAGLAITTLYFQTNLADPFNSPKMWIIILLASWLAGYVFSFRKLIKEIIVLRNLTLIVGFFAVSSLVVTLLSDFKYVAIFGDTQRRNGFLTYLSLSIIMISAALFFRVFNASRIYITTYFIGVITLVYAILQSSGRDFVNWNNPYNSIIGTVGNPNFAAAVMAIIGVLLFSLVFNSDFHKFYRFSGLIITGLLYLVIFLSDARQGLLALTLGIVVFLIIYLFNKSKSLGIAASGVGFFAFIFALLGMLQMGPLERFLYKPSVSVRGYYWRAGFEMLQDKPLIGVGMDRYGAYFKEVREVGYPLAYGFDITSSNAHNTFIQFFATGGIFLGISYLLLNLFIFKRALGGLKQATGNKKYLLAGIFSAWIAFHAQSLVSIDNIGIAIWGWLLGGAIIGISISLTSDENADRGYFVSKVGSIDLSRAFVSGLLGLMAVIMVSMLYRGENATFKARTNFNIEDPATKTLFYNSQKEVINNYFSDPSYALSSAIYLARGGFLDEGLAALDEIYANDPRNLEALNALILISEQLGKNNEAVNYRLTMAELDPWNAKNYLGLGKIYKILGDSEKSRDMLEKIMSFAPDTEEAKQANLELN